MNFSDFTLTSLEWFVEGIMTLFQLFLGWWIVINQPELYERKFMKITLVENLTDLLPH